VEQTQDPFWPDIQDKALYLDLKMDAIQKMDSSHTMVEHL